MYRVGLTGNVASGKSAVARVWRDLGATIVDADELARQAVEPGSEAWSAIVARWGRRLLLPDGNLDRAAMREIVFRDAEERRALEAIVHPAVARLRDEAYAEAEREGLELIVAEIPLLFEVGLEGDFDAIVLVDAPAEIRRDRLVRDRGLSPAEADRLIAAQWPSDRKRPGADFVIDNTGTLEDLEVRANEVWSEVKKRAADRGRADG